MVPSQPLPDPRVLRAIAHPVRNRILNELSAVGSMRAADIARELNIPANQASFHLRQLAKYGLVEEDPAAARDRRDRVWRPTAAEGFTVEVGALETQPGGKAAAAVFLRSAASWAHTLVDLAYGDERSADTHRATIEVAIRLTKDEARELGAEVSALTERWSARTRGTDGGRRTYVLHAMLQPYPELPAQDS